MASKIVTFSRTDSEWLPHIGDYDTYIFRYTVVESELMGKPESVKVKISRSTQTAWGFMRPDSNLDKVMFQFALDLVARKVQDSTLRTDEEVVLFNDAPQKCPYDPEKIQFKFGVPLEFQVVRPFGFKLP